MQRIFSYRQLANLIFPLIVEQILMGAIGALDVIMVAQLGENAVSGVSLVTSIDQLIISTFSALAAGGAIVCAQYLGNHQVQESRHTATQLLFISALFGSIVGVVCFLLGRPMLNFLYGQAAEQVLNSVYTRSGQNSTPNSNATNLHSSQKRCCSFCISSSNASPTFQVQKSIFHQMTKPIQVTVILPLLLAISFSRNDDIHSSISGISNDLIGVIPTIGQ